MEISILNASFKIIGVIDTFDSFIWTDRYFSYGDFELSKIPDPDFLSLLADGVYVCQKDSEHVMVIENIHIASNVEEGNLIKVKGKSIETILDRRIVWNLINLTGNFQDAIETLFNDNAINPVDVDRKISLLEFESSTDPTITSLEISTQFNGTSLYKVIQDVCIERNIGFKITLTNTGKLRFELYNGVDRSYVQFINPYVIFSPEFDNLVNSDYNSSDEFFKTLVLVSGENDNINPIRLVPVTIFPDGGSDLLRREMFLDASDITRKTDGDPLSDEEYDALLVQRGMEELAKNTFVETFEGQADITRTYIFGEDFFMGDILQISNEYGNEGRARIIELIRSEDSSGTTIYPTFMMITTLEGG